MNNTEKRALVIVDMIRGFIMEGKMASPSVYKIVPEIVKQVESYIKNGYTIIAFYDCHDTDCEEFKSYPAHCVKGSKECELVPELKKFEKHMIMIPKNTTNGFNTPEFREIAKRANFEEVKVTGCLTDICVEQFATNFARYNKLNGKQTKIVVPKNAVATFDAPNHNEKIEQAKSFNRMAALGITIKDEKFFGENDGKIC